MKNFELLLLICVFVSLIIFAGSVVYNVHVHVSAMNIQKIKCEGNPGMVYTNGLCVQGHHMQ